MSGIRQSFVFAFEADGEFGKGKCKDDKWITPPPGSYFNSTHNRQTSRIQSMGSKRWDTVAYGALSGQWEWTFNLDYRYLSPLLLVFEKYVTTPVEKTIDDHESIVGYEYSFSKIDSGKVPSFTVRRKVLNYMAGGPKYSDEIVELRGCVCKNFRFNKPEGSSQVSVTMTGFYVDEKMVTGGLNATDFADYKGDLVEWMCMYVKDGDKYEYSANTDNLGISIENNTAGVYNTCSPFAKNYSEGLTNYSFTTSCYSTDPDQYKRRLYYGGKRGWTGSTKKDIITSRPQAKHMAPIPAIRLMSYCGSVRDSPAEDEMSVEDAIEKSTHRLTIDISECVVKSMTWPKGNGGPLQDSISSAECKEIKMTVYIEGPMLEFGPSETTKEVYYIDSPDVESLNRGHRICDADDVPTDETI